MAGVSSAVIQPLNQRAELYSSHEARFLLIHARMRKVTVGRFMTRGAQTIGHQEPLAAAHRIMNEYAIRHLPVLDNGSLIGIVSQRDLHFIETLRDVDPLIVKISEAMSPEVYTTTARASLARVAGEMAARKLGSAVVIGADHRVTGIFTTSDALRALAEVLRAEPSSPSPQELRRRPGTAPFLRDHSARSRATRRALSSGPTSASSSG